MRQKSGPVRMPAEQIVKDIRRATRRHFSAENKIRIVLDGLRGEDRRHLLEPGGVRGADEISLSQCQPNRQ